MGKGRLKKAFKRAEEKAKKGLHNIIDTAKKAAGDIGFNALLPFRGVMVAALNKQGVPVAPKDRISKVALLFHDKVIRKKSHLDYTKYDHVDEAGNTDEAAAGLNKSMPVSPTDIVKIVLDFIKNLKNKKSKGEKLTPEEEQILSASENVSAKIDAVTGKGEETSAGDWVKKYWPLLLILAALILFAVLKKKK